MTESRPNPRRSDATTSSSEPTSRRATSPTAHAQAAKVLTTGASVSMVLGIVAYMAHSAAVNERVAAALELQAQHAAQATVGAGGLPPSTTLVGNVPMVVLADGTMVAASTLVPGATPTGAVPGSGTAAGSSVVSGGAVGGTVA